MTYLAGLWKELRAELDSASRSLASRIAESWSQVQSIEQLLDERFRAEIRPQSELAGLKSLENLFGGGAAERLLHEPLALYRRNAPLLGVITAVRDYENALDSLSHRIPADVRVSGADLMAALEPGAGPRWIWATLKWRARRGVALRAVVAGRLQRQVLRRGRLDGAVQLEFARCGLHLLQPWQICREHALITLLGRKEPDFLRIESTRWIAAAERHSARMAHLLDAYNRWAAGAAAGLESSMAANLSAPSARAQERYYRRQHQLMSYWSRQQRAVHSTMNLDLDLAAIGADATEESCQALESIEHEHIQLLKELDRVIEWLQASPGDSASFPPPLVRLTSAEEQGGDWQRRVHHRAQRRLPATVETVEPRSGLPGWRHPWRDLEPQKVFCQALAHVGTPVVTAGFQEVLAWRQLLTREIERAREVVAFGEASAKAEGLAGEAVAREATGNALALLLHHRAVPPEIQPAAETSLVRAVAGVLLESHLALEKGRVGLLAHVTRQRGTQAAASARQLLMTALRVASRRAWQLLRRFSDQVLIRIGWLAPPRQRLEPVTRRALLGQALDLRFRPGEMPMIYRRLFRLTPVEDPRFLVGRESETNGLADALARWSSGQRCTVAVVGARGSGKTSLLNCAVMGPLAEFPVIRGQFCERITSTGGIRPLIAKLLGLPDEQDLVRSLTSEKRVVILEELERTYLRVINGFDAIRELLDLMYETSGSTLWIFSINEIAFRYLNATVGLSRHFSHRVNAMAVSQKDLTNAILQRHNLSGLRLEFAPLPEEDPRVSRARRLIGIEREPEQLFFDSLYHESEGIFRAAMELWQRSIERVDGGIVQMRQPLSPNYGPLLAELGHDDNFILQAILQHGGLTQEETAQVLRLTVEDSRRRLERMRLLEIVEPDPDNPGLRVRPEAGLFVREALHRQNLW